MERMSRFDRPFRRIAGRSTQNWVWLYYRDRERGGFSPRSNNASLYRQYSAAGSGNKRTTCKVGNIWHYCAVDRCTFRNRSCSSNLAKYCRRQGKVLEGLLDYKLTQTLSNQLRRHDA